LVVFDPPPVSTRLASGQTLDVAGVRALATLPSVQPGAAPAIVPFEAAATGPEIIARPTPMGNAESFGSVRETFRPSSFVELLDASLALNGQ